MSSTLDKRHTPRSLELLEHGWRRSISNTTFSPMGLSHLAPGRVLWFALALCVATGFLPDSQALCQSGRTYTIAVVKDGPGLDDVNLELIRPELDHMLGHEDSFQYKQLPSFDGGWRPDGARAAVVAALEDPEVDLVLGLGRLVTQVAAAPDLVLGKPFVSAITLLGVVPEVPFDNEDFSTKANFSFVLVPRGEDAAVRTFKEIVGFESVHILVDGVELDHLTNIREELTAIGRVQGVAVIPIGVGPTAAPVLEAIGEDAEAVLLTTLPRLGGSERSALIDGLNARRLPTFSTEGESDLELGVLASNLQDLRRQTARRVASNAQRLLRGADVTDLPVFLLPKTRVQLNGRTAAAIGFAAGYQTRIAAEVLHPEALEVENPQLTLAQTFDMAEEGNVTLAISDTRVETLLRDKQVARADLYPQVGVAGAYNSHDYEGLESLLANQMGTVGFTLDQMIYNDRTISDFRSSGRLHEAGEYRFEARRLEVLKRAGTDFLSFSLARLNFGIELENLRLTEANLEIAQTRLDVGQAGRDEVYRWEAQVANQKGRLVSAEATVEAQRIALNQILGIEQFSAWRPVEIEVDTTSIAFFDGGLDFITESPKVFDEFREAAVVLALHRAPEVSYFGKRIEAQSIQVGQRKRSFYLPQVGASLMYDKNVYTSDESDLNREGSLFVVRAELPLFAGTRRIYDVKLQKATRRGIEYEQTRARQLVERRVRTVLRRLESSFPNLRFSRTAADKARRNFEVVREKYANGIVTITRLLEAQNAAFNAQLLSTGADFVYLKDLIDLQRSLAFYPAEHTPEELQAFVADIHAIMDGQEPAEKEE